MFSNLRVGAPLYVLHKQEPRLEIGEVIYVSQPSPQFSTTYNAGFQMPSPKMLVDLKIKTDHGDVDLQKIPSDLSIADFGNGMVISESRDAIFNEIDAMRKNSVRIIESVDQHKGIVEKCDSLLSELNPQIKQEVERTKELDNLKKEMGGIKGDLAELKGMLAKFLN
jgi:hypothetical protein